MSDLLHVVALSGGKDSTALALGMKARGMHVDHYLITPTGDELPEMKAHWERLEERLGKKLTRVTTVTLDELIEHFGALPNFRMRWCTRMLKIKPCLDWIKMQAQPVRLYVGFRADEEAREGLYDRSVDTVFPMRDWGWKLADVLAILASEGIEVPKRTDCARCYAQRLHEWHDLYKNYPEIYAEAEAQEAATGHTFRSPQRDKQPAALVQLRAKFDDGYAPKPRKTSSEHGACRVCSL